MKAIRLRTEYLKNPLGIDIWHPRLMWNCEGGVKQTAYQIISEKWDSGKIESSSMQAVYPLTLADRERVNWRIRLWDENSEPGQWAESFFEMGIFRWDSQWITGDYTPKTRRNILRAYVGGNPQRYPVDCFRKDFEAGEIEKARLYITACGLYEAKINGQRVGNFVMAPGYTDYNKRVQYQAYDVTGLVKTGANSLTVWLADGWYRGSVGAWGCLCEYGSETKLLVQLELTDGNGNITCIGSDGSWRWSNDGPIRFADNKDGEVFDARMEPGYRGKARLTRHGVVPTASDNVPVTEHERFSPRLITTSSGKNVLDFGQNIAGYVEFNLQASAGQQINLWFGEMLDVNGEFTQKNIQTERKGKRSPLQQVKYTCCDGQNHYKTTFAVFGFQYVLVETDVPFQPEAFTAIAVYSDMEQTGFFESSNELLNKFVDCTVWSARNNSLDIPTDCPTRERHGWAGDAQLFCQTAAYLFDYSAFARKYMADLYDWQKKDGRLPQIAPYGGVDFFMAPMNGSVGWADAGILMPYVLWKQYGDVRLLKQYYGAMKRYAGFMEKRIGKSYLTARPTGLKGTDKRKIVNCGQSFGEWAEPADVYPMNWLRDMSVPHPEESTAYTSFVLGRMAEIAEALKQQADAANFRKVSQTVREGYLALRKQPDFTLDTDRQARLVRPLAFGLLDKEQAEYAKKRLIQALDHYGWRLGTGFLSTPLILDVLADIDIEYAYRLLENEEMPGWLFMPKSGASTIWESWEGTRAQGGIASLDHYSKGACVEWLFKTMCGIRVAGENRFAIAPRPGGHFTYAAASYRSIYGMVECQWEKKEGKICYTITVPVNCAADVTLPDGLACVQHSGKARYETEVV